MMTRVERIQVVAIMVLTAAVFGVSWATYRSGYKDGQLDAARGRLRWAIMDSVVVEFHGLDVPKEAGK